MYAVRAERLRRIIDAEGISARRYAIKIGLHPSRISQLLTGYRPFNETMAREIEERAGLESGALDRDPLEEVIADVVEEMRRLPTNDQQAVRAIIRAYLAARQPPQAEDLN